MMRLTLLPWQPAIFSQSADIGGMCLAKHFRSEFPLFLFVDGKLCNKHPHAVFGMLLNAHWKCANKLSLSRIKFLDVLAILTDKISSVITF